MFFRARFIFFATFLFLVNWTKGVFCFFPCQTHIASFCCPALEYYKSNDFFSTKNDRELDPLKSNSTSNYHIAISRTPAKPTFRHKNPLGIYYGSSIFLQQQPSPATIMIYPTYCILPFTLSTITLSPISSSWSEIFCKTDLQRVFQNIFASEFSSAHKITSSSSTFLIWPFQAPTTPCTPNSTSPSMRSWILILHHHPQKISTVAAITSFNQLLASPFFLTLLTGDKNMPTATFETLPNLPFQPHLACFISYMGKPFPTSKERPNPHTQHSTLRFCHFWPKTAKPTPGDKNESLPTSPPCQTWPTSSPTMKSRFPHPRGRPPSPFYDQLINFSNFYR